MKEESKYYLYRHIKSDDGEPFYIGIGKKHNHSNTIESEYKRAYSKRRSDYWHNIVNKHGFCVEILFESESKDVIITKELEFIDLYGRRDINTGILCNMTKGGESAQELSHNVEMERRRKLSEFGKNRVWTDETKKKISKAKKKKVLQHDLDGNFIAEFNSVSEASKSIGLTISAISKATNNEKYTAGGYKWRR
jgi:hypothetical protein